ncbi:unnamed protein product [Euphydryas editha]|nr:unnamed protein product [Euphydryas editha]
MPQYNIVTSISISRLTEDDRKDPVTAWNQIFDEEMRLTILTWANVKIVGSRAKFNPQDRPVLKELNMIELNAFLG